MELRSISSIQINELVVTEYLESVSKQLHNKVMTLTAPTPTTHNNFLCVIFI